MKEIFKENKKLLSNIVYSGVFQFGNWLIPLLTTPYLIKVVGIEKFGLISFALTFYIYLFTIVDYGFNISATRDIAVNKNDKVFLSKYVANIFAARLILCLVCLLILVICVTFVPKFHNNAYVFFLGFSIVIGRTFFPNWFFQGIEEIRVIALLNFVTQIIFLFFLITFIDTKEEYLYVIFLQGIGSIFSSFIAIIIMYRRIDFYIPSRYELKKVFKEGVYSFITTASIVGYTRVNIILLAFLTNDTVTGYYSAIERIFFFLRQIIGTVVATIYPRVCYLTTVSHDKVREFFKSIYLYFIILIIVTALTLFFMANFICLHFIGNNYSFCVDVIRILAMSLIIIIFNTAYHTLMTAYGLNKLNAKVYLIAFFLNIFVNFFLVKFFGIYGSAFGVIIIESFITITFMYLMEKKYNYSLI